MANPTVSNNGGRSSRKLPPAFALNYKCILSFLAGVFVATSTLLFLVWETKFPYIPPSDNRGHSDHHRGKVDHLSSIPPRKSNGEREEQGEIDFEYTKTASSGPSAPTICPSASKLFGDRVDELESMIEKAKEFHQRGGNLVSVESYLNGHMQSTLDRLDIQFTPLGTDGQPTTISKQAAVPFLEKYYNTTAVKRGGYGQPLPGKYVGINVKKALHGERWIDVLEPIDSQRYRASIGHVGPKCAEEMTFGKDGQEKVFCVNPGEKIGSIGGERSSTGMMDGNIDGNIFSIGSNDQWGFENEVLQKLPAYRIHTFDCTLNRAPRRKPKSDNVLFYPYCIGSKDANPPYLSYQQLYDTTNTTTPPKLLKMDVEGFEYDVLSSILSAPQEIWPEQIMMEVHTATRMVDVKWMLRTRQAAEVSLFFGALFNHGGYIPVFVKYFDKFCGPCMEILLVRAVCGNT